MKLSKIALLFEGNTSAYWQPDVLRKSILPLYDAFTQSFPSLPKLGREDISGVSMSAATILYGRRDLYRDFQTMRKVLDELDEASCNGEWPGMIYASINKCEIVPYVGDRKMIVEWGVDGATVTFDLAARPSHTAIYPVVERIFSMGPDGDYSFVQAWDEQGNPVSLDDLIRDFIDGWSKEVKEIVAQKRANPEFKIPESVWEEANKKFNDGKRGDFMALQFADEL